MRGKFLAVWPVIVFAFGICTVSPLRADGSFNVGSFPKSTSGAPVTQIVAHGLGGGPKALILWTDGGDEHVK